MNQLIVENLGKEYTRGIAAVAGVSLDVREGECLSVVGASGSGKTTLLRMIAGFEVPTSGRIQIGLKAVVDGRTFVPPEARGVGMVFQEGALFPHLTVARNIEFGLSSWPPGKRASRTRELLGLVGMAGLEKRYPYELSGGQQQRVALARGLAPGPAVLLLDEPFSSVDEAFRGQLRRDVTAILRTTGTTTVLVTHDTEDALSVADRVAMLQRGRLLQIDTPEAIYNRPRTPEVAEFFGRMNIFEARAAFGGVQTSFGLIPTVAGLTRGQLVSIGIRPENLRVNPRGGFLKGIVEGVTFQGRQTEVVLRSPSGDSTDRLVIFLNGGRPPASGDVIGADVELDSLVIWVRPEKQG